MVKNMRTGLTAMVAPHHLREAFVRSQNGHVAKAVKVGYSWNTHAKLIAMVSADDRRAIVPAELVEYSASDAISCPCSTITP